MSMVLVRRLSGQTGESQGEKPLSFQDPDADDHPASRLHFRTATFVALSGRLAAVKVMGGDDDVDHRVLRFLCLIAQWRPTSASIRRGCGSSFSALDAWKPFPCCGLQATGEVVEEFLPTDPYGDSFRYHVDSNLGKCLTLEKVGDRGVGLIIVHA